MDSLRALSEHAWQACDGRLRTQYRITDLAAARRTFVSPAESNLLQVASLEDETFRAQGAFQMQFCNCGQRFGCSTVQSMGHSICSNGRERRGCRLLLGVACCYRLASGTIVRRLVGLVSQPRCNPFFCERDLPPGEAPA